MTPASETVPLDAILADLDAGHWPADPVYVCLLAPDPAHRSSLTLPPLPPPRSTGGASPPFWQTHLQRELAEQLPQTRIDSLLELRQALSPEDFTALVYNVSVGNQIIVRGDVFAMIASVLRVLKACGRVPVPVPTLRGRPNPPPALRRVFSARSCCRAAV